jgi:AcrR family transcriptional regulator
VPGSGRERKASTRASTRYREIVDAAQRVFAARGYRRTQTADVARELGVSAGLLYHYFESKEALFHAALETALDPDGTVSPEQLPVATPTRETTLAMVRSHVEQWVVAPLLEEALEVKRAADPLAELEDLVRAFYAGVERRRFAAELLERSAQDLPDLAALWYGEVRREHFERLARYLAGRMAAGQLRSLPDARAAARIVIETVVFFARHRHRDPFEKLDDDTARETVVRFVLAALAP